MSLLIQNLNKSYDLKTEKLKILQDLNLSVHTSEVVAIIGSSGSGKSTFLSLLAGLDYFDSGDIQIHNQSIQKLSSAEMTQFRAQNIGFVFQQFHLITHLTAFENLALPLQILNRPVNPDQIIDELKNVGLGQRVHHRPSELSGGECQRLALARGLITQPKLLLADEPSGSLDYETGKKVMSLFFEKVRDSKTTSLLVTHDSNLAKQCDRIFVLSEGKLLEDKSNH